MGRMDEVGIRQLRQNASRVIEAAAAGATFRVTNHGRETGVLIGKQQPGEQNPTEKRAGISPEQVINSGVYDSPRPPGYEDEMLRLVQNGRERSGRIGDA